ncbi:MAG TPA: DUF2891 family protein [Longimicrobiales bacterium]|nr:DUF2891 family protein [Longimicrobiales bacterium]
MLIGLSAALSTAVAQQPQRSDSIATRRDYQDLNELLEHLPDVPRPAFDGQRALWLGSLPLACIDRLQSAPRRAGRGNPGGGGAAADTTTRAATARGDSTGRGGTSGSRASASGADYFWVTTYRLIPDHKKTRAFWGCTDWHSAVSSIWVTARLVRQYPDFGLRELAREKLNDHLGKSNLDGELAFFRSAAGSFERPYGYAWLLKLHSELRAWPDSQARRWTANIAPLARWLADSLTTHIEALKQPVRTGTQANTALVLGLALDYATPAVHPSLRAAIVSAARRLYSADTHCDTQAEAAAKALRGGGAGRAGRGAAADTAIAARAAAPPDTVNRAGRAGRGAGPGAPPGANDILSPCLAEAALLARVLSPVAFASWLDRFLPPLQSGRFAPLTEAPGTAATASERARFAALAFQRAYALERIARALPPADLRLSALHRLSAIHADRGFQLLRDETTGTHWLPAFALLYVTVRS